MKKTILTAALLLSIAASLTGSPALADDTTTPVVATPAATTSSTAPAPSPSPTSTDASATQSPAPAPSATESPTATSPAPATTPSPPSPAPVVFTAHGAIGSKWVALKGASGVLGAPTSFERCSAGVCSQSFKRGIVYWTRATGAHPVLFASGRTGPAWKAGGGASAFGYPVTDETLVGGGSTQKFSSGKVLAWNGKQLLQVWTRGAIGARWAQLGGAAAGLGLPVSKETCGLKNKGCAQAFSKAAIYWSPSTGAHALRGAVKGRWAAAGAQNSSLGYPVSDEACGQPARGCVQSFRGGTVYWSPSTGAWATKGGLGAKYKAAGANRGSLGYPVGNEKCGTGGCIQRFQKAFIGWDRQAGARTYSMNTECQKLSTGRSKYPTGGANRVLLTFTTGYGQSHATSVYCKKIAGAYVPDWKTDSYVGQSGFKAPGVPSGPTRYMYSPTGAFTVTEAFGLGNPGTRLKYTTLNPNSRWGGNPWTATYNKYHQSSSWTGWDENMWYFATRSTHDYRQGVVINYNRPTIVQDAGFAIFLHMNKTPTAGCIALDDWAVVDYIRKSTPGDRIIMGTYNALFR